MPTSLPEIVALTRQRLAEAKRVSDPEQLAQFAERHTCRGFRRSLERAEVGVAVIAELKKASPSQGAIRANFPVGRLAAQLASAGAAALSVLTEERFFQGSLANLWEASAATHLPCLRKDFIVDPFQLLEAKANRADAVLLILAALTDAEFTVLLRHAHALGLDALCEVHDEDEVRRAIDLGAEVVGVNNRDLRTLQVDLGTALRLADHIPAGVLRVAESGMQSADDIRRLRAAGYQAFLIGESLMRAESPGEELRRLLAGAQSAGAA
jgi:indole-3-glycerol phosphate synthase